VQLTKRTAVYATRTYGGVGRKTREGLPTPIRLNDEIATPFAMLKVRKDANLNKLSLKNVNNC